MPVEAVLNAYPDWKIPAEVIAIVPTADRTKATVKVRIAFKAKDPRIVPDMGVRVSFLDPAREDAPKMTGAFVPERAVVTGADGSAVFVVEDGAVRRVAVTLGEKRDADQQVLDGLAGGETVVLSPPEDLGDGDRVATK
jgi:multidrug efflux pump subunit AcrA (membrane-fusion protein)